jgi:8-oxo-dGTP pyrophosphatase MutT (NUDIX family)
MWVFPGGKVDPADLVGAGDSESVESESVELDAARRAAVREAEEEARLRLEASGLVVLSFWMPPPEAPRRFATWFFLAQVESGHQVVVDQSEIHAHRWVTPNRALELRDEGEIELAPPTYMTLWWLTRHPDAASALAAAAAGPVDRYETRVAVTADEGRMVTVWAGDAAYGDGDLGRVGPRRRLYMDPGRWYVEIGS